MRSLAGARLIAAAAVVALAAGACSSDDTAPTEAPDAGTTTAPGPTDAALSAYEAFRAGPTACGAEKPPPVTLMTFDRPVDMGLDLTAPVTATIATSCGDLVVELDPRIAPLAVNSFVFLADRGFYDGIVSHRIMSDFMFQAGDQTATGGGDAGYRILLDEWPAEGFLYERGVVAMANAGPQSTGSQFFIMIGDRALPPNYTVIGRVVGGEEVLDAIAEIPVAERPSGEPSLPLEALYIESIDIAGQS